MSLALHAVWIIQWQHCGPAGRLCTAWDRMDSCGMRKGRRGNGFQVHIQHFHLTGCGRVGAVQQQLLAAAASGSQWQQLTTAACSSNTGITAGKILKFSSSVAAQTAVFHTTAYCASTFHTSLSHSLLNYSSFAFFSFKTLGHGRSASPDSFFALYFWVNHCAMLVLFYFFMGEGLLSGFFFFSVHEGAVFAPVGCGCCAAEAVRLPASGKPQHNGSRTGLETGSAPPLTREQCECLPKREREWERTGPVVRRQEKDTPRRYCLILQTARSLPQRSIKIYIE